MAEPVAGNNFWEENPNAAQDNHWTSDPFIATAIYERISKGESRGHWIDWLFNKYLKETRLTRILSIGCGVGDHEIAIGRILPGASIDAFDFSTNSVALAKAKAAADGLTNIDFFQGNFNEIVLPTATYDLVLCSGSLHHVRELEHLLGQVKASLTAD
jgi:ubiquinone/menaquinone biosynthesis C-methylase UbiE